jgi:uncharacterized protein
MSGGRAAPILDEESMPFWAGLVHRRVVLQQCPACGRQRFPRMPSCPFCGTAGGGDIEVSGSGCIYSWVTVHRALTEAMADAVPYSIAAVDLDGGGRMFGRLADGPPGIGLRVRPHFVDHMSWTELQFELERA